MRDTLALMEEHLDSWLRRILGAEHLQASEYIVIVDQLFCAISTAYTDYPHARPVQKLILDFVHAGRLMWPFSSKFKELLPGAPQSFTHAFLVATINGNVSKWTGNAKSIYHITHCGKCTWCKVGFGKGRDHWAIDPRAKKGGHGIETRWRCKSCVEKHGFKSRQ